MKMKLKTILKRWVLRVEVAGAAVTTFLLSDPTAAALAWQAVPSVIKAHMTQGQIGLVGVAISLIGFVATVRRNKQNEAVSKKGDENAPSQ